MSLRFLELLNRSSLITNPVATQTPNPKPSSPIACSAASVCNTAMPDELPPVLALAYDLIFATKITTAARSFGVAVKLIRDPAKLAGENGRLLLVDLNLPGAIEAAAAWQTGREGTAIGFVSHVDADTAVRARAAGIDTVMARSRFAELLGKGLIFGQNQVIQSTGKNGGTNGPAEMDRGIDAVGEPDDPGPSGGPAADRRADSQGI
ncbi:MAG TPA: hypothetical protein VFC78_04530 [Tepidisphaeraceae bacterium]|nr:hypothetical protein [Tepidisphaeraceae bacterium]